MNLSEIARELAALKQRVRDHDRRLERLPGRGGSGGDGLLTVYEVLDGQDLTPAGLGLTPLWAVGLYGVTPPITAAVPTLFPEYLTPDGAPAGLAACRVRGTTQRLWMAHAVQVPPAISPTYGPLNGWSLAAGELFCAFARLRVPVAGAAPEDPLATVIIPHVVL